MGVSAVFDTNILIDCLNNNLLAMEEIEKFSTPCISIITFMEVMIGTNELNKQGTRDFLANFLIYELTQEIAELAISIRKHKKSLKLPDAIILATARVNNSLLITRNTKDFSIDDIDIRVPYNYNTN